MGVDFVANACKLIHLMLTLKSGWGKYSKMLAQLILKNQTWQPSLQIKAKQRKEKKKERERLNKTDNIESKYFIFPSDKLYAVIQFPVTFCLSLFLIYTPKKLAIFCPRTQIFSNM